MNYNEYNNKCNKYLTSELNKKYKVFFYNDINYQNYLILENSDKKQIMCEYKILCSYDEKLNYIKLAKDMKLIDKNMIEKNIKINNNSYELNQIIESRKEKFNIYYNLAKLPLINILYSESCLEINSPIGEFLLTEVIL